MTPILIFDMDGTLLSVNSYPIWVRYLIFGHFPENKTGDRLRIAFATIGLMLQRKLMKKDHAAVKAKLQQFWTQAASRDPDSLALEWLVGDLFNTVRPNLFPLVAQMAKQGEGSILATAAAGEYAIPLGQRLGFKHILATPPFGAPEAGKENHGAVKRDRVMALLKERGWENRPRTFFTDHEEDMPLIEMCDRIIWFGNEAGLKIVKFAHPNKPVLNGLEMDGKEMLAAVAA